MPLCNPVSIYARSRCGYCSGSVREACTLTANPAWPAGPGIAMKTTKETFVNCRQLMLLCMVLAALLLGACSAGGSSAVQLVDDGTASGDSPAGAQVISREGFTLTVLPESFIEP